MFWTNYVRLCYEVGKSPNQVAEECGVKSSGTVTGWKNGAIPRPSVLKKIAEYFSVSVDDLLIENEKPASVSADGLDSINLLSPELLEELSRFVRLAKANPERALRFLSFANQEIESQP